jgi:lipoic acid synthetase
MARAAIDGHRLHTVCEEARCPNIQDCWGRGTATFMVAGKECTRGCRFCSVETLRVPPPLDPDEPEHLAAAVERMGLAHVVVTVVNRDDLADGGADHYKRCIIAVHRRRPVATLELLSSDLAGNEAALAHLLDGIPLAVFAHNVECVPRLDRHVRDPRASFQQSLRVLSGARRLRPDLFTKTSLMVGLGETDNEVADALIRLRQIGTDMITLGQYLAPTPRSVPVARFVPPEQFDLWKRQALELGFLAAAAGPLVRSSFRAGALLAKAQEKARQGAGGVEVSERSKNAGESGEFES